MKKIFLLFLVLLPLSALAQWRKTETFYDAGKKQPKEVYFVRTSPLPAIDGLYTSYHPNGKEKSRGNFVMGKQTGNWTFFYDNGSPKMTGTYQNSQRTGFWKYYFENGKVSSEGTLLNGIRNGAWKFYHENEERKSEGEFKNGKKNGSWQYFFEDGTPKAQAEFRDDIGYYREFDRRGKPAMEGWNIHGQSDSTWKYFYENGQIRATGNEKNGTRNGFWQLFHENGRLAAEGNYKDGIADGKWTYYHDNGNKSAEGVEKAGQREGSWKLYYPTGTFKAEGEFSGGSGSYQEFYESGKRKVHGFLQKGINQGIWRYYYEDGTLEGEADFKDGEGLFKGFYPDGVLKMQGFLRNGRRIGTWEIFKPDGKTAGFIKNYHDENNATPLSLPDLAETDSVALALPDTSQQVVITKPQRKGNGGRIRRNHTGWRYFTPKIHEFRSLIVGINPAALIFSQLPLSAEYYYRERLGYELNFTYLKDPFFKSDKSLNYNTLYYSGFSVGLRQKFYSHDRETGMFYFGHELRFTEKNYGTNFYDSILPQLLTAAEKKYEYSLLVGNRWLAHPGSPGFTFDISGGIGFGYRDYSEHFQNEEKYKAAFDNVNKNPFVFTPRLGFTVGYAF